jgi:hypothetical protein
VLDVARVLQGIGAIRVGDGIALRAAPCDRPVEALITELPGVPPGGRPPKIPVTLPAVHGQHTQPGVDRVEPARMGESPRSGKTASPDRQGLANWVSAGELEIGFTAASQLVLVAERTGAATPARLFAS